MMRYITARIVMNVSVQIEGTEEKAEKIFNEKIEAVQFPGVPQSGIYIQDIEVTSNDDWVEPTIIV